MSLSSSSDEENAVKKFNVESQKSKNETELANNLESLEVGAKRSMKDVQLPPFEERINRQRYSYSEEDAENAKKVDSPSVSSSKPRIPNMRQYRADGNSGAGASNWRSPRTHYSKDKEENNSVSLSKSWRDPSFKYERCNASRDRRNEIVKRNPPSPFGYKLVDLPTFAKPRDRSKQGNWTLSCAPDIILDNGLVEVEHVRNCVNELHRENGELFATPGPSEFKTAKGDIKINCFTSNYEDKVHVVKVADVLMKKIRYYPYCMFYFYNKLPLYMRTCENEFYELSGVNWKLIEFND